MTESNAQYDAMISRQGVSNMSKGRILVVEDEEDIYELIRYNLIKEGYIVQWAKTAEEALQLMDMDPPDLITLDLMLPGMDGFEFFRAIRPIKRFSSIPVIIVSAKTDETTVVTGLEFGAVDFITKPFNPRIFVARVRKALRQRKSEKKEAPSVIKTENLVIDTKTYEVTYQDESISLTVTEFKLLYLLANNSDRVWSRTDIINEIKGEGYGATTRSVDVQMVGLRKKLKGAGRFIKTIRGVGYRFLEFEG